MYDSFALSMLHLVWTLICWTGLAALVFVAFRFLQRPSWQEKMRAVEMPQAI